MADGNDADSVRFTLRPRPSQVSWATNLGASAGLPRPVHPGFHLASHLLEAPDNATEASWAIPRVGLSPTGYVMLQAATSLHPHCRASSLLQGGRSPCPHRYSPPPAFGLKGSPSWNQVGAIRLTPTSGRLVPTFHTGARTELVPPVCRMPPGQYAGTPQTDPE